jgi:hypothetical protein
MVLWHLVRHGLLALYVWSQWMSRGPLSEGFWLWLKLRLLKSPSNTRACTGPSTSMSVYKETRSSPPPAKAVQYTTINTGGYWIKFLYAILVCSTSAAYSAHHNLGLTILAILWNAQVLWNVLSSPCSVSWPVYSNTSCICLFCMWFRNVIIKCVMYFVGLPLF